MNKPTPVSDDLYYIQNRGFCGNYLIWWRAGGHGYTCNLREAWMVSKEKAYDICRSRPDEDFPWRVQDVTPGIEMCVSVEKIRRQVNGID